MKLAEENSKILADQIQVLQSKIEEENKKNNQEKERLVSTAVLLSYIDLWFHDTRF